MRIGPHPVRRVQDRATAAEQCSVRRDLAQARDLIGDVGSTVPVNVDVHRMVEVTPFAQVLTLGAEDLDPVVLSVGDQDAAVRVDPDRVRRGEVANQIGGIACRTSGSAQLVLS